MMNFSSESELSDEYYIILILQSCVFFFLSVITFWKSKNASIFFNRLFSGRKVNLVGTLGGHE